PRITLLAHVVRGRKGYHKEVLLAARKLRLKEARIDGRRLALADVPLLDRYREHDIDLVVATLAADTAALEESLDRALRLGGGAVVALADGDDDLGAFTVEVPCDACAGERLNARARAVRLNGRRLVEFTRLAVADAERAVRALRFNARDATIAAGALKEILPRLRFLGQ